MVDVMNIQADDGKTPELADALARVRFRWLAATRLAATTRGLLLAGGFILALVVLDRAAAPSDLVLLVLALAVAAGALAVLGGTLWSARHAPTDRQVARFVEERCPELEDRVACATEFVARPDAGPFHGLVVRDAADRVRSLDLDRVISRKTVQRTALRALGAIVVMAVAIILAVKPAGRAVHAFWLYGFPERVALDVTPGDARVVAGRPLKISARLTGAAGAGRTPPTLSYGVGDERQSVPMQSAGDGFWFEIPAVMGSFQYRVSAAKVVSRDYTVTALQAPRIDRIDVHYQYPAFTGLKARLEEDGGDIYAPAGTVVRLQVHADKPVRDGVMVMSDGTRFRLAGEDPRVLETTFKVSDDGAYRVSLADHDGLQNPGETEYFIRTMDDRPPEVRIVSPGSDRQVTPLEEVRIEARADDDYGLERFELVYSVRGGPERAVRFPGAAAATSVTAAHTMYVEDLKVQPGDFVTYYARARDVGRAKKSTESRSDIFFLEIKPFEEEFVASQSQAMGGGGGETSLDELATAQKEIIIATWKLDRRSSGGKSTSDIKAVAKAQGELKTRAEQAAAQVSEAQRPARRRIRPTDPMPPVVATEDPMRKAVAAMGRAEASLDGLDTAKALPSEMEALNELLKAAAELRRRQVSRQQASGGGGSNRNNQDLSALFDKELQRQQQTNYETRNSSETRERNDEDDALAKLRELARRQDEMARQQRDLARQQAQMTPEELKRQLERLTREQSELRRQAEELARELARLDQQQARAQQQSPGSQPQQGQGQGGQGQGQGGQASGSQAKNGQAQEQQAQAQPQDRSNDMREASEEMRSAASELRREDLASAAERSASALEKLRDLEQRLQGSQPDDRRRALGELQLEAQQVADAQRRIASETERVGDETRRADGLRRLAGDKERLADRVEQLESRVRQLSSNVSGEQRAALSAAAAEMAQQQLGRRMRESAENMRQAEAAASETGRQEATGRAAAPDAKTLAAGEQGLAQALDRLADRIGAATGNRDAESRRLSDDLARARDLRERLSEIERKIEGLSRGEQAQGRPQGNPQGAAAQENGQAAGQAPGTTGQPQASQGAGQQGAGQEGQQGTSQGEGQQAGGQQTGQSTSGGGQAGTGGGQEGELARLQADYDRELRRASDLMEELRRANPALGGRGGTPEGQEFSLSAPGTEAFKQDFARWEVLKAQVNLALERVEASLSQKLRAKETQDRLNAGADQRVPEEYRKMVAKYYQDLAAKKP
jgi:hypothetical protein